MVNVDEACKAKKRTRSVSPEADYYEITASRSWCQNLPGLQTTAKVSREEEPVSNVDEIGKAPIVVNGEASIAEVEREPRVARKKARIIERELGPIKSREGWTAQKLQIQRLQGQNLEKDTLIKHFRERKERDEFTHTTQTRLMREHADRLKSELRISETKLSESRDTITAMRTEEDLRLVTAKRETEAIHKVVREREDEIALQKKVILSLREQSTRPTQLQIVKDAQIVRLGQACDQLISRVAVLKACPDLPRTKLVTSALRSMIYFSATWVQRDVEGLR